MPGYRKWLNERANVERHILWQRENGPSRNDDSVTEATAATTEAYEATIVASILDPIAAGAASGAVNGGLDNNLKLLVDVELGH